MESYQCECGGLYGGCGHRAPTLRRDAASTYRTLASDPFYGAATGIFWVALLLLGAIAALVDKVPSRDWPAIGTGAGVLALVIAGTVVMSKAAGRKKRVEVDTGIY